MDKIILSKFQFYEIYTYERENERGGYNGVGRERGEKERDTYERKRNNYYSYYQYTCYEKIYLLLNHRIYMIHAKRESMIDFLFSIIIHHLSSFIIIIR